MEQYKNIEDNPHFYECYSNKYNRFVNFQNSKDVVENLFHLRNAIEKLIFGKIVLEGFSADKNLLFNISASNPDSIDPCKPIEYHRIYANLPENPTCEEIAKLYNDLNDRCVNYFDSNGRMMRTVFNCPMNFEIHIFTVSREVWNCFHGITPGNPDANPMNGFLSGHGKGIFSKDYHYIQSHMTRILLKTSYLEKFKVSDNISEIIKQ